MSDLYVSELTVSSGTYLIRDKKADEELEKLINRDFIDIQTLGAKENTDITNLLIDLVSQGQTAIYIPNKTYYVSKTITLKSNMIIYGGILQFTNKDIVSIFNITNCENISLINVTFNNNYIENYPIYISGSNKILISKCNFKNMYRTAESLREVNGIYAYDSEVIIENCSFNDYGYIESGQQIINQMACISANNQGASSGIGKITVINCSFKNVWIGIYSGVDTLIQNCVFDTCQDNPFYSNTNRSPNVTIQSNTFKNVLDETLVICGNIVKIIDNIFNNANIASINILNNITSLEVKGNSFNKISTIARIIGRRIDSCNINYLLISENFINFDTSRNANNSYFPIIIL